MKSFEDKFSDNVREVFENYTEEVDQKAFKDMQNLLRKKSRKRVVFLYSYRTWAAAAAILLMLGGSLYFSLKFEKIEEIGKIEKIEKIEEIEEIEEIEKIEKIEKIEDTKTPVFYEIAYEDSNEKTTETEELTIAHTILPTASEDDLAEDAKEIILPPIKQITNTYAQDISENQYISENVKKEKISALNITAGSMIPFAEMQIATGYGFAAGVMNDWNITPSISLSTGGLFVYNKFSYDSNNKNLFRAEYDNIAMGGGEYAVNTVKDFEIFAIDIPLNAKVDFYKDAGTKLYITAGVSSLIYLHQSYSEQGTVYGSYLATDSETNAEYLQNFSNEVNVNEEYTAFQHFDLAGLLNLSFGYQKIRENHKITIEPFVKLPISNITSKNIKMGMGGIMLKISL